MEESVHQIIVNLMVAIVVVMNIVSFLAMGIDKWLARHQKSRIPEKTLLWLAFGFGGFGSLLGMKCFRHKTMKKKFSIGVPLLLALNVVCLIAIGYYISKA